jgi:hypothetical protein
MSRYEIDPGGVAIGVVPVSDQLDYSLLTMTGIPPMPLGKIKVAPKARTSGGGGGGGGGGSGQSGGEEILIYQPTIASVPLVGRITKHPLDRARYTVDFTDWLDPVEILSGLSDMRVTLLASSWPGPWPPSYPPSQPPVIPPPDPTPLIIHSIYILSDNLQTQVFVDYGSDGNTYSVEFLATGTSGRTINVRVDVSARINTARAL